MTDTAKVVGWDGNSQPIVEVERDCGCRYTFKRWSLLRSCSTHLRPRVERIIREKDPCQECSHRYDWHRYGGQCHGAGGDCVCTEFVPYPDEKEEPA